MSTTTTTILQTRKESACSCLTCKLMCKQSPCFASPQDAKKIIDAGYKDRLRSSVYIDLKAFDINNPNMLEAVAATARHAIAPQFSAEHGCTFQGKDGLCELHEKGLKPTEGRLANHNQCDDGIRRAVCDTWISREGIDVMQEFDPETAIILQRRFLNI